MRPVWRLRVVGGIWCGLALLPLLLAATVKVFTVGVLAAIVLRGSLGAYALVTSESLRKNASARLSVLVRIALVLAPILSLVVGIAWMRSESRDPSPTAPELRLGDAGVRLDHRWYGDRDNPSMVWASATLVALVLGITIASARERTPVSP